MAGRIVLAKATLSGIPTHVMSYIKLSESITKSLDKTIRDFIWGTTQEKKQMHFLDWDTVTLPKDREGLDIHKTAIKNRVILSGLAWRVYQNSPNLWRSILQNKYTNHLITGTRRHCVFRTWKTSRRDGKTSLLPPNGWYKKVHMLNSLLIAGYHILIVSDNMSKDQFWRMNIT